MTWRAPVVLQLGLGFGLGINITGTILHDLASTCVGNETYLSASYWHPLDMMLDTDEKENLYSGVPLELRLMGSPVTLIAMYAAKKAKKRLAKTRNLLLLKSSPVSYGLVMMRSCSRPHST